MALALDIESVSFVMAIVVSLGLVTLDCKCVALRWVKCCPAPLLNASVINENLWRNRSRLVAAHGVGSKDGGFWSCNAASQAAVRKVSA